MSKKTHLVRPETVNIRMSETNVKYLKVFMRLHDVDLMAQELKLSPRTIRAHLRWIEWAVQSADCFE
jgi:DNA-binding CsgD family transcriptional regulator